MEISLLIFYEKRQPLSATGSYYYALSCYVHKFGMEDQSVMQDLGIFGNSGNPGKHFGISGRLSESPVILANTNSARIADSSPEMPELLRIPTSWICMEDQKNPSLSVFPFPANRMTLRF